MCFIHVSKVFVLKEAGEQFSEEVTGNETDNVMKLE